MNATNNKILKSYAADLKLETVERDGLMLILYGCNSMDANGLITYQGSIRSESLWCWETDNSNQFPYARGYRLQLIAAGRIRPSASVSENNRRFMRPNASWFERAEVDYDA